MLRKKYFYTREVYTRLSSKLPVIKFQFKAYKNIATAIYTSLLRALVYDNKDDSVK